MLPWNNKFLESRGSLKPKTIFCGSDGQDVKAVTREIAKSFISSVDNKDYSNCELEDIASHNFYFLKKDPEKNNIPIAELRAPRDFLSLGSSSKRMLFIQGGEDIRIDGYNSLLKVVFFSVELAPNVTKQKINIKIFFIQIYITKIKNQ